MKTDKLVQRWVDEGTIDHATASRILESESNRKGANFGNVLIGIAGLAIFLGIAAIIGVNWDKVPPDLKIGSHAIINGFLAVALFRHIQLNKKKTIWFELLVGLLAALTLTFIGLVGQIYQTQEPTWKALAVWMALTTPFWLGLTDSRKLARLWILSFLVSYGLFVANLDLHLFGEVIELHHDKARALLITLLPFGMIALGQTSLLQTLRKVTFREISKAGFVYIAIAVSLFQLFWREDNTNSDKIAQTCAMLCGTAAFGIIALRRLGILVSRPFALDVFLVVSIFTGAIPLLIVHQSQPVIGAITLMAYWALCGWVGLKAGYPRALNIAALLISFRLVGVYIEVFGSLLKTGEGLVTSGVLLIALVWGTRKIMARMKGISWEKIL